MLPDAFLKASLYYDGSGFITLPMFAIAAECSPNVLQETKRLRAAISFPPKFLVLGEPPESLVVLDCESGEVTWCSSVDAVRIGKVVLVDEPDVWPSFDDFFSYLLDEEEQD